MSSEVALEMHEGRWKRYPAYKDSGVEWLGEVPGEWGVKKIKNLVSINGRIGFRGYTVNDLVNEREGALTLGAKHINKNNELELLNPEFISWEKYYESPEIMVSTGDLILTQRGSVGKVAIINKNIAEATINPSLVLLKTQKVNGKFLYYFLISDFVINTIILITASTAVPMISQEQIGNINLISPPLPEQCTIAAFLDCETGRIDTLIEKKERQIELLQEKRAALISHAVTKGLDPNVKMKDSGVEWLGEIPEHWDETITSALFMDNKKKNKGTQETNLLSLSYGNIIRKDINTNDGLLPETFEAYQIVYPGYIVLRLTDLQNDKRSLRVGHVNEKGIITSAYTGIMKKSGAVECSKYFYYLLHTYDIIKVFYGMGAGVRQSLNFNELRKLGLLLPPPEEQKAIVSFIDHETEHIDILTTKVRDSISKLREYRTALISAAVTGKIDVRNKET